MKLDPVDRAPNTALSTGMADTASEMALNTLWKTRDQVVEAPQAEHHRRHRGQQVDHGDHGPLGPPVGHLGHEQRDADADRDGRARMAMTTTSDGARRPAGRSRRGLRRGSTPGRRSSWPPVRLKAGHAWWVVVTAISSRISSTVAPARRAARRKARSARPPDPSWVRSARLGAQGLWGFACPAGASSEAGGRSGPASSGRSYGPCGPDRWGRGRCPSPPDRAQPVILSIWSIACWSRPSGRPT